MMLGLEVITLQQCLRQTSIQSSWSVGSLGEVRNALISESVQWGKQENTIMHHLSILLYLLVVQSSFSFQFSVRRAGSEVWNLVSLSSCLYLYVLFNLGYYQLHLRSSYLVSYGGSLVGPTCNTEAEGSLKTQAKGKDHLPRVRR